MCDENCETKCSRHQGPNVNVACGVLQAMLQANNTDRSIYKNKSQSAGSADGINLSPGYNSKPAKPKPKPKPTVLAERNCNRTCTTSDRVSFMGDKEFEKLVRLEKKKKLEKQMAKLKELMAKGRMNKKKKKKKAPKAWKWDIRFKCAEGDNENYCHKCRDGGHLILCDTCHRSYHQRCLRVHEIPNGNWSCPVCTDVEKPNSDSEDETQGPCCKVCSDYGNVISCNVCLLVYHPNCMSPPLTQVPDYWECPRCMIKERPLKGKIKAILTWRWANVPKVDDKLDHTHSPVKKPTVSELEDSEVVEKSTSGLRLERGPHRELFVWYHNHSHWECEWVPELALEVWQSATHASFRRKWDLDTPPALEDGSSFGRKRHRHDTKNIASDPHDLEGRYYRYGIKPEWLQIQRILDHDGPIDDRSYLVKWQDLMYDETTWEDPNFLTELGLLDWDQHIKSYWSRRNDQLAAKKKKVPTATLR